MEFFPPEITNSERECDTTSNIPDSLTCRPDVGRRSALVGHIGRYGRHQADVGSISGQIGHICRYGRHLADVGSISGQIGHICRYGRHLADIEPTCKHGVGPISADMRRYRPDIISDIRPISRPTFPDIGPTSGRSVCAIWDAVLEYSRTARFTALLIIYSKLYYKL